MLLEIFDIKSFKVFFDVVYDSVSTIEFKLSQSSLKISLLNKAHTVFYDVEYDKNFFGDYIVDDVESVHVIADDLFKVLKSASGNDTLILESNDDYLICNFESDKGSRRIFELPLAQDYGDTPVPPDVPCSTVFDMGFDDLKQSSADLDKIVGSKNMKLSYVDGVLNILAGSDAMTNYINSVDIGDDLPSANVTVSIDYMNELLKFNKLNKVVELRLGDNLPLQYTVQSVDECIKVNGLIAPILEE